MNVIRAMTAATNEELWKRIIAARKNVAVVQAYGHPKERLRVVLVQMVNLLRGGQKVEMSKRSGDFITLREVMDKVGADAAKFFFLMRDSSTHLDFD